MYDAISGMECYLETVKYIMSIQQFKLHNAQSSWEEVLTVY